jgi:C1A family cysteine protease
MVRVIVSVRVVEYFVSPSSILTLTHNPKTFMFYSRGIYNAENCCSIQNHAVLIVGYGKSFCLFFCRFNSNMNPYPKPNPNLYPNPDLYLDS